jgi:DNA polymerase-3 subunit beta
MKLSCTKENLAQGLSITSHVSTKNMNLPILNNVLVKADAGGLKLISTNLEIAITCSIRAKVEQQGEYTVPSKLFYDFVNLLPNEPVDIDLHDDGLFVSCASAKTTLKGMDASEFPLVPPVQAKEVYEIPVTDLAKGLGRTLFATATNESRPELTGLLLSIHHPNAGAGTLTLAATDSYRLAECVIGIKTQYNEPREVIVPSRTLSELSRILSVFKDDVEAPERVSLELSDNQVVFRYGSVELVSRTIDGNYPDYRQIIPTEFKTKTFVDRSEVIQAIKSASLFAKNGLFDVQVMMDPAKKIVQLSAQDATRGENSVSVKVDEGSGEENTMVLNYRYLLDGLQAAGTQGVQVQMIDAMNPCVIRPTGEDDKYQYIVMPIRQ